MLEKPQIESLSTAHRKRLFLLLAAVFLISFPVMVFYTAGYRLDLGNEEQTIVTTGGIYITTDTLDVEVYLDDEQVERPRLFRSAYYIQNIAAGQHRVVVQRPDLAAWVKELPVDSHMVIEAAAFTMPAISHVRPIPQYVTATGTAVYLGVADKKEVLREATSTLPMQITASKKTTGYVLNEEYDFVKSLFGSTSTTSRSVFKTISDEERFRFSTTTATGTQEIIMEPKVARGNIELEVRQQELYAVWKGATQSIPYYFCISHTDATSTALRYGQHVADAIEQFSQSTTTPLIAVGSRLCRPEIKLDRLRKDVYFYDFFPNSSDLVLLQLSDGLYVTEIDDRAWQNVQQIYEGTDFQVVIENNVIYVQDGPYYFEVITRLETN